jgi:hypothetical protein
MKKEYPKLKNFNKQKSSSSKLISILQTRFSTTIKNSIDIKEQANTVIFRESMKTVEQIKETDQFIKK